MDFSDIAPKHKIKNGLHKFMYSVQKLPLHKRLQCTPCYSDLFCTHLFDSCSSYYHHHNLDEECVEAFVHPSPRLS